MVFVSATSVFFAFQIVSKTVDERNCSGESIPSAARVWWDWITDLARSSAVIPPVHPIPDFHYLAYDCCQQIEAVLRSFGNSYIGHVMQPCLSHFSNLRAYDCCGWMSRMDPPFGNDDEETTTVKTIRWTKLLLESSCITSIWTRWFQIVNLKWKMKIDKGHHSIATLATSDGNDPCSSFSKRRILVLIDSCGSDMTLLDDGSAEKKKKQRATTWDKSREQITHWCAVATSLTGTLTNDEWCLSL